MNSISYWFVNSKKNLVVKLKIFQKQHAFSDSLVLTLRDESGLFSFRAGQYLTLILNDSNENLFKSFSIASAPYELPNIEIAFRLSTDDFSKKILNMQPGDYVFALPAIGNMTIKYSSQTKYFFISMGSGITPFYSIVKQLIYKKFENQIHLVQSNSTIERSFYNEQLKDLSTKHANIFYTNMLTRRETIKVNRLNCDWLKYYFSENNLFFNEFNFYISGNSEFVSNFVECLKQKNVDTRNIHIEKFDYNFIKTEVKKNFVK